ncbi:hypothetical protein K458DRAFT_317333, partial [Lentithecium fluviatile CBS 122367]
MEQSRDAESSRASKSHSHPIYETLQNLDIRLLVLAPGLHHDPLKAVLISVSCTHNTSGQAFKEKYVALSYTWGDQSNPASLELNGSYTLPIGRNLAAALKHARLKDSFCVLWVDALCIDQNDEVEKSRQVQRMPTIYEAATMTLIWLG